MAFGQGLFAEHIEGGPGEVAGVQGLDQVVLGQVAAARGIDHEGACGQGGEHFCVEDALGIGRQRQKADQDSGAPQERVQTIGAVEAFHAFGAFCRAAPPGDGKAQTGQLLRRVAAEHAEAEDADGAFSLVGGRQRPPAALALERLVAVHVLEIMQHPVQHEVAHALRQRAVDQPDEGHVRGQAGVGEHVVDAGAQVDHRLEVGIAAERARLVAPDQGVQNVGGIAAFVGPDAERHVGQELLELDPPVVRLFLQAGKQDGHGLYRLTTPLSSAFISNAAAMRARV